MMAKLSSLWARLRPTSVWPATSMRRGRDTREGVPGRRAARKPEILLDIDGFCQSPPAVFDRDDEAFRPGAEQTRAAFLLMRGRAGQRYGMPMTARETRAALRYGARAMNIRRWSRGSVVSVSMLALWACVGCQPGYMKASELESRGQGPSACAKSCEDIGMRMAAIVLVSNDLPGCVCQPVTV